MSPILILIFSLLACLLGTTARKVFCAKWGDTDTGRQLLNAVCSLTSAVILFLWGGLGGVSWYTALLGAAFGIVTALQMLSTLKAMALGSWAYTTVITSLSTLIPALSGCLFWQEQLLWPQIVGIVLLVVCLILSVEKEKTESKRQSLSLRWLLYCAVSFLCGGLIGVMQKIHQASDYREELNAFLIIAFAVSFVYSGVCSIPVIFRKDAIAKDTSVQGGSRSLMAALFVLCGVGTAVNNKLNLYLSGVLDSAFFFPVFNGANLVLTTLIAVVCFREHLSGRQWIGLVIGIVSVIFLCNPFA